MTSLYAEYLPNIKTLTITAILNTPRDDTTALWLTTDRTKLVLEHADETHHIQLPAKVSGQGSQHLQLPNTGESHCANRIPAESLFTDEEGVIPWTANALTSETEVRCKQCDTTIISSGKITIWKDLPSEAWAEMMDLWHCHKPAEPDHSHDHDDAPAKKGYAAGSKLVAQAGTGFVDVMSFLVAEDDCSNFYIKPSTNNTNETNTPPITCKTCTHPLGNLDQHSQGLRLEKVHLTLLSPSSPPKSYTPSHHFSAYLSSTIATTGVRKFVFATLPYELWVFSTNLAFASLASPNPQMAMKVLFREREGGSGSGNDVEVLRRENLLIEMLSLGRELEGELLECLRGARDVLPEGLRKFVGWEVAVLPVLREVDLV